MLLEIGYKSKKIFPFALSSGATKGSKRLKAAQQLPGCQQQKQVAHTSTLPPKPQRVKLPYVATKYACENLKSMWVSHLAPAPTGYLGMKKETRKVNSVLLDVLIFSWDFSLQCLVIFVHLNEWDWLCLPKNGWKKLAWKLWESCAKPHSAWCNSWGKFILVCIQKKASASQCLTRVGMAGGFSPRAQAGSAALEWDSRELPRSGTSVTITTESQASARTGKRMISF